MTRPRSARADAPATLPDTHSAALASYAAAVIGAPSSAEAHCNLGRVLQVLGREDEALAWYDKALAIDPDHVGALENAGCTLKALGRIGAACRHLERAIAVAPRTPRLYYLVSECRALAADEPLAAAMRDLLRDPDLPPQARIHLDFALSNAYAGAARYDESFQHLIDGNAAKRRTIAYDEATTLGELDNIRAAFSPETMCQAAGHGDPSATPVFIVGMPRSGTTLIEQILASHPLVFGAGEIQSFRKALSHMDDPSQDPPSASDAAPSREAAQLDRVARRYLQKLTALAPGARRITDKQCLNFAFLGLIHLALPNARIIHVCRDPIDTCLSCFSKLFTGEQPYAYDLAELGRYYGAYAATMRHWRQLLPDDVLIEVQYEDVVADLDGQARRIVAHCGLDWDAACLDFHRTARTVRTASALQVRQPIYHGSVGRWRAYGDRLAPLIDALAATA